MPLKVNIASALLVGFLLWQGVAASLRIGEEIHARVPDFLPALRLNEAARVVRDMRLWEGSLGLPEGTLQDSYRSLSRKTPAEAKVFLISKDQRSRDMVLSHLKILLLPRRFWLLDRIPDDWESKAKALLPSVYILEIGPESDPRLREKATLLNAGRGFFLWEYEG